MMPFWTQCTPFSPKVNGAAITNEKRAIWSKWPVVLSEPFQDNRRRWLSGAFDDVFAKGDVSVGSNVYTFDLEAKQNVIYASTTGVFPISRQDGFYLAVDTRKWQETDSGYGLIFLYKQHPDKDRDHYFFELNNQDFRFSVRSKGVWRTIIHWTQSTLIRMNQSNRLAVFVQGKQFTFFINDMYVVSAEDETLTDGQFGLGVELFQAGDTGAFEFKNYEVRTP